MRFPFGLHLLEICFRIPPLGALIEDSASGKLAWLRETGLAEKITGLAEKRTGLAEKKTGLDSPPFGGFPLGFRPLDIPLRISPGGDFLWESAFWRIPLGFRLPEPSFRIPPFGDFL